MIRLELGFLLKRYWVGVLTATADMRQIADYEDPRARVGSDNVRRRRRAGGHAAVRQELVGGTVALGAARGRCRVIRRVALVALVVGGARCHDRRGLADCVDRCTCNNRYETV